MISIVLAGRNDDYGKGFRERLFRATEHNATRLRAAGIDFEFVLAEWNPLPEQPPLSVEFVRRVPNARAVIIPPPIHDQYTLNTDMPFHEMAAKNAALRRSRGEFILVANADILLGDPVIARIANGGLRSDTLYRAHRVDVANNLSWEQMQDPANQLLSGEGKLPPCYYLGAGGDFCLASRGLWHRLRGFNERIRFSTRAKDWQFFLSAAACGVSIEFIGDVYHLDHEGGFRNTDRRDLDSDGVHFGGFWDIEFGLPVMSSETWGFQDVRERTFNDDPRIVELRASRYAIHPDEDRTDRELRSWLTRPRGSADVSSAFLFHAICAAHAKGRRLLCRLTDRRALVALAGMEPVASTFSVDIRCNMEWPELAGFTMRPFVREPDAPEKDDWILEENGHGLRICESGSGAQVRVWPQLQPVQNPEFNPVLVRRLLRACLALQKRGVRRIAIYGAGGHTENLLRWGVPDSLEVGAILESEPKNSVFLGHTVRPLSDLRVGEVDAIVLSSSSFEPEMADLAIRLNRAPVVALYSDWPPDLWKISAGSNREEEVVLR